MVGVDARRPGFLKRVELQLGILIDGAHPRVSDDRQQPPLSRYPVELSVLILPVVRLVFKTKNRRVEPGNAHAVEREVSQSHRPNVFETGGPSGERWWVEGFGRGRLQC